MRQDVTERDREAAQAIMDQSKYNIWPADAKDNIARGIAEARHCAEDPLIVLASMGLRGVRDWLQAAPLESGYCCCGSPVESHGINDGHSPVDELSYSAMGQIEAINALLARVAPVIATDSKKENTQC